MACVLWVFLTFLHLLSCFSRRNFGLRNLREWWFLIELAFGRGVHVWKSIVNAREGHHYSYIIFINSKIIIFWIYHKKYSILPWWCLFWPFFSARVYFISLIWSFSTIQLGVSWDKPLASHFLFLFFANILSFNSLSYRLAFCYSYQ